MQRIDNIPGRTVLLDGSEYLYFSGTSYLGIAQNKNFSKLVWSGLKLFGNNYSSSRISNLQLKIFEEAECYMAAAFGSESALTMSSGYIAGQVVVQILQNIEKVSFIYAPKTHPALWRNLSDFFIEDFDAWTNGLIDKIRKYPPGPIVILCNSIDPLYSEKHSFNWIRALPDNRSFIVVLDDSHGFGITGKEGSGIYSECDVPGHVELIVLGSLGKALGIPGGVILSSTKIIDKITKSAFFGGSSPAIPAYLFAYLNAETVYKKAREKLMYNIRYFSSKIQDIEGFQFIPEYPVFYTGNNSVAAKLLEHKILISSFPYPTPVDGLITRIIINSLHSIEDIDYLVGSIKR